MKRFLITGASGFIGAAFLKRYGNKLNDSSVLKRGESETEVDRLISTCDAIVHLAYDRFQLTENFRLLDSLLRSARRHKVKRFVFMSTFAVYDPLWEGPLTENSSYSEMCDHYSFVKIKLEERLMKYAEKRDSPAIVILQPGIVFGEGGNWFFHAVKSLSTGHIRLPLSGNGYCNAVSVDDVCDSIFLSLMENNSELDQGVTKLLITGRQPVTWLDFYKAHLPYVKRRKVTFDSSSNASTFSASPLKEVLYRFLFTKIAVRSLVLASGFLFKLKKLKSEKKFDEAIHSGEKTTLFEPEGINRVVHSCRFVADSSKAMRVLGFKPSTTSIYDFFQS